MSNILVPADYRKQLASTDWVASVSDVERLQHAFARLGHVCSVAAVTCFYTTWSDHEEAAGWMCLPDRDVDLDQLLLEAMQHTRYRSIIEEFAKSDWEYSESLVKAAATKVAPVPESKEAVFGFHLYGTVGIVAPNVAPYYSMPTFDSLRCTACGFVGCFEDFFVSLPADPLVPDSQPNAFLSCQMCGHKGLFTEVNDVLED